MQFSHPLAEQAHSGTPASHMAHENLFREPEFAPGTPRPDVEEMAPVDHRQDTRARPRRTTRRRTAA